MSTGDREQKLRQLFEDFLRKGSELLGGVSTAPASAKPVVVTGAALGLPGGDQVFDPENVDKILHGKQLIDVIPVGLRQRIVDKKITRLVKADSGARFESIDSAADVIKLAGQGGTIGLDSEFGVDPDRARAMDSTTQMAIAVGLEALRDAGIPLVLRYKTTTKGTKLPDRWSLPESMRDDTGIIFGSAFPGYDAFAEQLEAYSLDQARRRELNDIEALRARVGDNAGLATTELDRRIHELRAEIERAHYGFDRRFVFRVLAMGHSQFAEHIGARGPNTQINSACASGTQAVSLAEDWIRAGRCRRVIIVTADNATSEHLIEWIGSGFLASGAAATDEVLEEAALPFDRRRHGLILGMGASAMVVESRSAAAERGIRPICEVLGVITANSAFHGSRLDIDHIAGLMERLVAGVEAREGIDRKAIAANTVFVSHETYTPARGGSAQAEINALRRVFGDAADDIVIANTKGLTGHAMGAGIEDAVAVKILETGLVPPVANIKEIDPDLGELNLSKGGVYPVHYALRLGAGFGSQISLSLSRWVPSADGRRPTTDQLGYEYRLTDRDAFETWLKRSAGHDSPVLEVESRTLRVVDRGMAVKKAPKRQVAAPVPAPAAPAPAPAPAPSSTPTFVPMSDDAITATVLSIVAEQTGYPSDMLDPDLDLEADLGIDTVKQAETFAAVREAYDIPRDDNLQLREFPTLKHVIGFVKDRLPASASAPAPAPASAPAPAAAAGPTDDAIAQTVLSIVAEQTGYPPDMLDLELDLEADLGIDTVKQAETFAAVRESFDIPRQEDLRLSDFPTLASVVQFVYTNRPDLVPSASSPPAAVVAPVAAAPAASDPVRE
ncbi:MAG: beta-ketoacyl synthase, partial [Deltaproteobacteria bacterium]|nr:beta-ketoacyl synthase [Deltaproteobacteria bacterium]